jgi:hypothetical protein
MMKLRHFAPLGLILLAPPVNWVPETLPLGVLGQAQGQPGYTYNANQGNAPIGISYVFVSDTPEPGTFITLLSSLALLGAWRKRR